MNRTGVYPGSFDPITLGHMDIIRRGAKLVDRLVIGVTTNPSKSPMFSLDERMAIVRREVAEEVGVRVDDPQHGEQVRAGVVLPVRLAPPLPQVLAERHGLRGAQAGRQGVEER